MSSLTSRSKVRRRPLWAYACRSACALVSVSQCPWLPGRIVKLITSWKNPKLTPKLESEHLPSVARCRSGLPVNNLAGGGETGTECPERSGWAFTESTRKKKEKEKDRSYERSAGIFKKSSGFENKMLNLSIRVLKKTSIFYITGEGALAW